MNLQVVFLLSSLTTLAIVHALALEFFLYWKYLWLDIPMHLLGGLCVALGFSVLPFFRINLPARFSTLFVYVVAVLLVGIAWEVFEVSTGVALVDEYYAGDTVLDLCMDILGGIMGYALVTSIKKIG